MNNNFNKQAITSIIIGAIFNVANLIMTCMAFFGPGFIFGGIFILFPIAGLSQAIAGLKGDYRIAAIIGLVLNAFATLGSLGLIILGVLGKLGIL